MGQDSENSSLEQCDFGARGHYILGILTVYSTFTSNNNGFNQSLNFAKK
jgi:hypothetical protein